MVPFQTLKSIWGPQIYKRDWGDNFLNSTKRKGLSHDVPIFTFYSLVMGLLEPWKNWLYLVAYENFILTNETLKVTFKEQKIIINSYISKEVWLVQYLFQLYSMITSFFKSVLYSGENGLGAVNFWRS